MMPYISAVLLSLYVSYSEGETLSICPNFCSSNGVCTNGTAGSCNCFPGFGGVDCSIRYCPAGIAWVDLPYASNSAHRDYTECSNMGECDRSTGICICRSGFTGPACDTMLCPTGDPYCLNAGPEACPQQAVCSGNGRCISLSDAVQDQTFFNSTMFKTFGYSYTDWDAEKIYGCACDPGWEGIACDKRSCPLGPDPQTSGVDEVQLIDCRCSFCRGGIYLAYKNMQSDIIPWNAAQEVVQYRLAALAGLDSVEVQFLNGNSFCSSTGAVTKISFKHPSGPQPQLQAATGQGLTAYLELLTGGDSSAILTTQLSQSGTKRYIECSGRGNCDYSTGTCQCFAPFRSSNGVSAVGSRGDCGDRYSIYVEHQYLNGSTVNSSCPFVDDAICSGNGDCNEPTGTCTCNSGYTGAACDGLQCQSAQAWFGNVGVGHWVQAECAGVGECDSTTGICKTCGGTWGIFDGDACEYLACSTDDAGNICGNNGRCLTLQAIAPLVYNDDKQIAGRTYTTPWDASRIQGCLCDRASSIDNQYFNGTMGNEWVTVSNASLYAEGDPNRTYAFRPPNTERFYRGPYAFAETDFSGYNCGNALCPKGDDPQTRADVNEIQLMFCRADYGNFTITFRGNTTLPIPVNATAYLLEKRLEELSTIRDVSVTMAGRNRSICNYHGNIPVYIEFLSEHGNLPLLQISDPLLHHNIPKYSYLKNNYLVNITEYQKGTKEEIECSGRGICNERSGVCSCSPGFSSSNGTINFPGDTGDCSYFNPFYSPST